MEKVSILMQMRVEPAKMPEAEALFRELQAQTLQAPGLDYFYLVEDSDDKSRLFIIERWDCQEDFARFISGRAFKDFGLRSKGVIAVQSITKLLPFFKTISL